RRPLLRRFREAAQGHCAQRPRQRHDADLPDLGYGQGLHDAGPRVGTAALDGPDSCFEKGGPVAALFLCGTSAYTLSMILIGQYDSPSVRRVGIAITLYGMAFEHRPWSTFGDADKIRAYNPLTRVPTLVLDSGEVLIESHLMLDHLDSLVPPERRMFPVAEPQR